MTPPPPVWPSRHWRPVLLAMQKHRLVEGLDPKAKALDGGRPGPLLAPHWPRVCQPAAAEASEEAEHQMEAEHQVEHQEEVERQVEDGRVEPAAE